MEPLASRPSLLEWVTRFVRAFAPRRTGCDRRQRIDCGACAGPRDDAERSSCDRGGS